MRNILEVIDQILNQIPQDFDDKIYLTQELQSIRESYIYSSPEGANYWWLQISHTLITFLKKPDTDWKKNILNLFSGNIN